MPEELSVIGCSDDPCFLWAAPRLTTIHLPVEEMGAVGVQEITKLVAEAGRPGPQKITLPPKLVERDSCAAI